MGRAVFLLQHWICCEHSHRKCDITQQLTLDQRSSGASFWARQTRCSAGARRTSWLWRPCCWSDVKRMKLWHFRNIKDMLWNTADNRFLCDSQANHHSHFGWRPEYLSIACTCERSKPQPEIMKLLERFVSLGPPLALKWEKLQLKWSIVTSHLFQWLVTPSTDICVTTTSSDRPQSITHRFVAIKGEEHGSLTHTSLITPTLTVIDTCSSKCTYFS